MNEEFDTIHDYPREGLHGFFDFRWACPSDGIANGLNKQSRDAQAKTKEYLRKISQIKTGYLQKEIQTEERLLIELNTKIQARKRVLQQEQAKLKASGLGAFCQGAANKRRIAERNFKEAQRLLGEAKKDVERQTQNKKDRLTELRKLNNAKRKELAVIEQKITQVKKDFQRLRQAEILKKKAQEMALQKQAMLAKKKAQEMVLERQAMLAKKAEAVKKARQEVERKTQKVMQARKQASEVTPPKVKKTGSNNMLWIGLLGVGAVLYATNKKGKKPKKVTA